MNSLVSNPQNTSLQNVNHQQPVIAHDVEAGAPQTSSTHSAGIAPNKLKCNACNNRINLVAIPVLIAGGLGTIIMGGVAWAVSVVNSDNEQIQKQDLIPLSQAIVGIGLTAFVTGIGLAVCRICCK